MGSHIINHYLHQQPNRLGMEYIYNDQVISLRYIGKLVLVLQYIEFLMNLA